MSTEEAGPNGTETPPQTKKYLTIDDWKTIIDKETQGKRGNFRILNREIFSSRAYRALTLPQREILLCYLNHLEYPKREKNNRRQKHSQTYPMNAKGLMLTNNEIKARGGVNSDKTIANARKALVDIGFLDVVQPGSFRQSGIFALSHRWRHYPDGDYRPKDDRPTSYAPYASIHENYNLRGRGNCTPKTLND